ncbi:MAG TPA: ArsI/CadI family heavy metal resistance metalloenzyme [Thermoanaerobaculia bacterium]|nr:ArsI/CadI family heavy metal resistance metalloenzyme [Thermoanaerobaculia bacterium]
MKRLHVMLKVRDLDGSLAFYRELFAAEPTVRKPDYAKWMLDDPRVNFSIGVMRGEDGEVAAGIEHLGIQAESPQELSELRERIGRAGGTVDNEGETTCCYANSDKTWVVDAQGVAWEAFYTSGVATSYRSEQAAPGRGVTCCQPTAVEVGEGAGAVSGATDDGSACCEADCCSEQASTVGGLAAAESCCSPSCCATA